VSDSGIIWAICKSAPRSRQPHQHPSLSFLQAGCPSCHPTNSVKALKAYCIIEHLTQFLFGDLLIVFIVDFVWLFFFWETLWQLWLFMKLTVVLWWDLILAVIKGFTLLWIEVLSCSILNILLMSVAHAKLSGKMWLYRLCSALNFI